MTLSEIRRVLCGAQWAQGPGDALKASGATTDTRAARAGELFFAIRGQKFDGHAFLPQAAQAGCVAAVVQKGLPLPPGAAFGGGLVEVEDTTAALGSLAAHHRRTVRAKVLAVTGSNGKTTVKRMIHHVLSRRLAGSCSPKSFNNNIGVPLTLLAAGETDDYVVCEVGTSAPGEIAELAAICRPDVAVITSVGPTHLERLGSVEGVAVEKASLLGRLADGGAAVVWADSEPLKRALAVYACRLVRFGDSPQADLRLTGYQGLGDRQTFEVNGSLKVFMPCGGRHNAMNALSALAAAGEMGLALEEAAEALAGFQGAEMRLQWLDLGAVKIINDAYNANPASLLAAADVLAESPAGRRVLVAGDMRELGERAGEMHEQAGRDIARRPIDLLIGVGELGGLVAGGARELVATRQFESVDRAESVLPGLLRDGDVILVKGSRAMGMERLVDAVRRRFTPADKAAQPR